MKIFKLDNQLNQIWFCNFFSKDHIFKYFVKDLYTICSFYAEIYTEEYTCLISNNQKALLWAKLDKDNYIEIHIAVERKTNALPHAQKAIQTFKNIFPNAKGFKTTIDIQNRAIRIFTKKFNIKSTQYNNKLNLTMEN